MTKLSIIIPAYNASKYIEKCIDSVLNQGIPSDCYEIIIVNDGSTDNTVELAQRYISKFQNIKLFTQENHGQSAARNKGIDVATGEYIAFVDADDLVLPYSYGKIINTLIRYPAMDINGRIGNRLLNT